MSGLMSLPTIKDSLKGKPVSPKAMLTDAKEVFNPTPKVIPAAASTATPTAGRYVSPIGPRLYPVDQEPTSLIDDTDRASKRLLGA